MGIPVVCKPSQAVYGGQYKESYLSHQFNFKYSCSQSYSSFDVQPHGTSSLQACQLSLFCRESQDFELNLKISLFCFNFSLYYGRIIFMN